jgi:hypothetical protein
VGILDGLVNPDGLAIRNGPTGVTPVSRVVRGPRPRLGLVVSDGDLRFPYADVVDELADPGR